MVSIIISAGAVLGLLYVISPTLRAEMKTSFEKLKKLIEDDKEQ